MKRRNVVFKEQLSHQVVLFPSSIGERIPEGHAVRLVVDRVVDELNIDRLISTYKGGGTSSYGFFKKKEGRAISYTLIPLSKLKLL